MSEWKERVFKALYEGPWPYFGNIIRVLRGQAQGLRAGPLAPRSRVPSDTKTSADEAEAQSVAALCILLDAQGYTLTEREYADIESGATLPNDPNRFIEAFAEALELDEEGAQSLTLGIILDVAGALVSPQVALEVLLYLASERPSELF
jgi:hypothetical protein